MDRWQEEWDATWRCRGWQNSWQAGLLAAAILSSCFLLTQAQEIPVRVEPSRPLQGRDVTLTPGGDPSVIQCTWYRGVRAEMNTIILYSPAYTPPLLSNGPRFTGRENIGPNCSLHISNLTLNDSGIYTVSKTTRDGPQTGSVAIQVFDVSPPTLRPTEIFAEEHTNVTLNFTTFEYPGQSLDSKSGIGPIIISMIVLGSLAIAALAGALLYRHFRTRSQKQNRSRQVDLTSPVYENTRPSAQVGSVNSSEMNTYEELQHGNQTVYDQLKW